MKTRERRLALERALTPPEAPPTASELAMLLRESIERKPMLADTYHRIKGALARWDNALKAAK